MQMDKHLDKMHIGQVFLCVQMGVYLIFLQLLLCCAEISLEKYPVPQLTMPSSTVTKLKLLDLTNEIQRISPEIKRPHFSFFETQAELPNLANLPNFPAKFA